MLRAAEEDFLAAIDDYETKETGLGIRFKEEVRAVIDWIAENSELPRVRPKGYRRVTLKIFKHYIAYLIWSETIWVLAIAHGRRRPEYWLKRKKSVH